MKLHSGSATIQDTPGKDNRYNIVGGEKDDHIELSIDDYYGNKDGKQLYDIKLGGGEDTVTIAPKGFDDVRIGPATKDKKGQTYYPLSWHGKGVRGPASMVALYDVEKLKVNGKTIDLSKVTEEQKLELPAEKDEK